MAFAILAMLLVLPWFNMNAPLHYDEAYTLDNYALKPYRTIVTDYSLPNNHIGHSLLLRTWWEGLGRPNVVQRDVWFMRVPVLVLWDVGLLSFFALALMVVRPRPIFAAVLTVVYSTMPHALEYAFQLRGYGPSIAWYSLLLACTAGALRSGRAWLAPLAGFAMFMANYTVPTNLIASGGLWLGIVGYTWCAASGEEMTPSARRRLQVILTVALTLAMFLSVAAYLPVREQMRQHAHPYSTVKDVVAAFPGNLWTNTINVMEGAGFTGIPWLTAILMLAGLATAAVQMRRDERARLVIWLVLPVLLLTPTMQSVLGPPPFTRNFCVMLPMFVVLMGWATIGAARVADRVRRSGQGDRESSGIALAILCGCMVLAAVVGGRHWARLVSEHQPVKMLESLKPRLGNGTIVVYDREADSYALYFYGRALDMQRVAAFYEFVPKSAVQVMRTIFVAVGKKANLGVILRYFGLEKLENTPAVKEAGRFGKVTVYEVSGLQARNP